MPYKLRRKHVVGDEFKRVTQRQVQHVAEALSDAGRPDEAVHDARRHLKRARAVLRLLRPTLGDTWYDRENGDLRGIARILGPGRDAVVLMQTMDGLIDDASDDGERDALVEARPMVEKHADELREQTPDLAQALRRAATRLRDAATRIEGWDLSEDGADALAAGLHRSYRQGRQRMAKALRDQTDEAYHDWRKRVKDLLYQATLLKRATGGKLRKRLDKLADVLGDDHDLAVLRQATDVAPLHDAIRAKQAHLRRRAAKLGRRVYDDKPRAFVESLIKQWSRGHMARQ